MMVKGDAQLPDWVKVASMAAATVFASHALEAERRVGLPAPGDGARERLIDWICRRGAEDERTSAAIAAVQAKPVDEAHGRQLREALQARASRDPVFGDEFVKLVRATPEAKEAWRVIVLGKRANDQRLAGKDKEARLTDEELVATLRSLYRGDHPDLAKGLNNLAVDLIGVGDNERARELLEEALTMRRRLYRGDSPYIATNLVNLARTLRDAGETQRARELDEEALAMWRRNDRRDHPVVESALKALALDMRAAGESERAGELDEEARAMRLRNEWWGTSGHYPPRDRLH
jgi:tetratricopeptide (TPR) repeat protein